MNFEQAAILTLLFAMLVVYATDRFRIEVVALTGLAVAYGLGVVPVHQVFAGFASPAVITVIEVLLIVGVLTRTRIMDGLARRIVAAAPNEHLLILLLGSIGAGVSVFMNNIGALALVFPVAISVCARLSIAPAKILMALSFATLLGGMCSLTGTPANLVVNQWVVSETGRSLGYFDLGIVGAPLTLAGVALLTLISPRVFARNELGGPREESVAGGFIVERVVGSQSALVGMHVPAVEDRLSATLHSVIRNGVHVFARRQDIVIAEGDLLLLEIPLAEVSLREDIGDLEAPSIADDAAVLEFVIMPDSLLLGSRVEDLHAYVAQDIRILAIASRRGRVEGRLADVQLSLGDVILIAGDRDNLARLSAECGLLALAPRRTRRPAPRAWAGIAVFAAGILATAFAILPTEIAFGTVVIAMALMGQLNLRTALQDINWSIVLLLACMIPLGMAVEDTGAARVIADGIAGWLPGGEPLVVVMVILVLAVSLTPFIDNVSTAIVLSPIAAGLATRTGTPIEPALMAVAIGASLDFLTPFGHHNNAVVMGAGGYRFSDFSRLGVPLTLLCIGISAAIFAAILAR